MKDKTPTPRIYNVSLCPLLPQVERLLDDIVDGRGGQLSKHIQTCASCSQAVEYAQHRRALQRRALRNLLIRGEMELPSATAHIMESIRSESVPAPDVQPGMMNYPHEFSPIPAQRLPGKSPARSSSLQSLFLLAVAAVVIVASLGVFAHLVVKPQPVAHHVVISPTPLPPLLSANWNSVIMSRLSGDGSRQIIENYDPASGKSEQLQPGCCSLSATVDGIAHNGHDFIVREIKGQQTYYHLLTGQTFVVADRASNAIWETEDHVIFLDAPQGFMQIDVSTGVQKKLFPALRADQLLFYYNKFVYFLRADGQSLYRINSSSGLEEFVAGGATSRSFWLSPTGAAIYYLRNTRGQRDVYAVDISGANALYSYLLFSNGTPIGYAADSSLMFVRQVQGKFQLLVKTNARQETIVLDDIAVGATMLCDGTAYSDGAPICDSSIALAPFGIMLVIEAGYADGSHKVWSIDLQLGKRTLLFVTPRRARMQIIGWAKFLVR